MEFENSSYQKIGDDIILFSKNKIYSVNTGLSCKIPSTSGSNFKIHIDEKNAIAYIMKFNTSYAIHVCIEHDKYHTCGLVSIDRKINNMVDVIIVNLVSMKVILDLPSTLALVSNGKYIIQQTPDSLEIYDMDTSRFIRAVDFEGDSFESINTRVLKLYYPDNKVKFLDLKTTVVSDKYLLHKNKGVKCYTDDKGHFTVKRDY